MGLGVFSLAAFLDYRRFRAFQKLLGLYLVFILLLLFLAFTHQRWLHLGPLSIQPSEFAKPFLVVLLASLFSESQEEHLSWPLLAGATILALGPVLLIAISDLDQAFLILVIACSLILFAGLSRKTLLVLGAGFFLLSTLAGPVVWKHLKPYQRARLISFFKPGKTHKRWSYQTRQALIAVGSGGLTGQGFKRGLSSRLHYLPAKHTDLAFAVWAEEWGFAGSLLVLTLYSFILSCLLKAAYQARDLMGRFLVFGAACVLFWEIFFNIGGVIHLLPAASLPLPFLSCGGSALCSNMILLGLATSVMIKRFSFI